MSDMQDSKSVPGDTDLVSEDKFGCDDILPAALGIDRNCAVFRLEYESFLLRFLLAVVTTVVLRSLLVVPALGAWGGCIAGWGWV
jgi:hypothetical protein